MLKPFQAALSARRAQDPEGFVCAFFITAEVMGILPVEGHPSAAELEALLDQLDRHQTYLLRVVLDIMASIPDACMAAARWELRATAPKQRIRRKLASFDLSVLRLINSRADADVRVTAELFQRFRALPPALRRAVPDSTGADLPLLPLQWIEGVIDDGTLSIPRKAVVIHQLRLGMTPADLVAAS
ncbi:MAG: hypothetical protein GY856_00335 [bacterium]|nr:hypothetical protein [bacterium]